MISIASPYQIGWSWNSRHMTITLAMMQMLLVPSHFEDVTTAKDHLRIGSFGGIGVAADGCKQSRVSMLSILKWLWRQARHPVGLAP